MTVSYDCTFKDLDLQNNIDINCNFTWFEILNNECLWKSWVMNLSRVMNRSKRSSRAIILSIRLHFVIRDVKINFFVYPILTKQYNFHQCWPVFTLVDNWKRCRGIIHWNKRGFMSKRTNTKKLIDKNNLWRSKYILVLLYFIWKISSNIRLFIQGSITTFHTMNVSKRCQGPWASGCPQWGSVAED